ncbi:toll/interleukin-1 receptor domain-containing protein [Micromonospora sp. NPDC005367]|uniref:toll/interleukin-1 receptor domain-containing protein n=1 Tax=Micromonospora sp. NPDC005367 TaxID=3155590 RepID=UPI0033A6B77D
MSERLATAGSYDAFLSYSHAIDSRLALELRHELLQFARPWHRRHSLRIISSATNLAATPDLWATIEATLGRAKYFILLASPQAAQSRWVSREVAWWLANRSPERMLIVLTSGTIEWSNQDADFDWIATNALPATLTGAFSAEPRWVDFRTFGADDSSRQRDLSTIADLAAPLHSLPRDALVDAHVGSQRQIRRIIWACIAGLSAQSILVAVLLVLLLRAP